VCNDESYPTDTKQAFLEAENDFCKLEYKNDDLSDLTIRLDRSKILTSGRKGELATADYVLDQG
jgi:dipeptidyl-peptidase III